MGVFPEPALCADDVSRLVPNETDFEVETVAWLPRAERQDLRRIEGRTQSRPAARRRVAATLVAGLLAGFSLPQTAFAPAAAAHDRIDLSARGARSLASALPAPEARIAEPGLWGGVPLVEQEPATAALIQDDLAALPQPAVDAGGEKVRFGSRRVSRRVVDTILKASEETGVDPVYMMALADKESSFSTDVKSAASSAVGLFQFVTATWLEMIRDYGGRYGLAAEAAAVKGRGSAITVAGEAMRGRVLDLRKDPYVAALMAAELVKRDRGRIEARVGRALTTSELYLAHFLGTSSAGKFLSMSSERPGQVAAAEFRSAARANRSLFTERAGKGRRSLTVAEVYDRIDGMIDQRLVRFHGVAALAPAADEAPAPVQTAQPPLRRIEVTEALPPDGV